MNTLPLCVVGNVACAMDVLGFVVPELSRLDLSVLTASASALYSDLHSDLSAPKRQKLRAAKEANSHKYVRYDIWLDATSIYDNVAVNMSSANVLLTRDEKEWMRREVQEEWNLYIVDDFNVEATIGLSIAPSEVAFARTRVSVESEMMCVRLTREKYLAVMRFARIREAVESSEVSLSKCLFSKGRAITCWCI